MRNLSDTTADGAGDGPDLRVLLVRGVKQSFGWVCLFVAVGAAVGLVVGLIQPNTYVSNTKLLLRVGVRELISSESLVNVERQPQESRPTMVDELQMLADVAVFERIARKIGPREILEPADPRRDDGPLTSWPVRMLHGLQARSVGSTAPDHECEGSDCATCLRAATKVLMEQTTVTNEPGSNVVLVSHTSTSAEKAHAVTQAVASAFIERHREQFSTQPLVDKNRGKLDQVKAARDAATDAYFKHVDQCGFIDLETQGPALLTEINTLESELFTAQGRRAQISRQRSAMADRLTGVPSDIEVVRPAVMVPNEEYETQLTLKRTLLAQRQNVPFENHPKEEARRRVQEYDKQIAKVEETLQRTPQRVMQSSERRERESLGRSAMAVRIDEFEVEDAALGVKVELLQERLAQKAQRATELRRCEQAHADLLSVRDAEEGRYQHLLQRFSVLQALGSDDGQEDTNLRVLQTPTMELEKVGPKRLSLLLKGLIGGLVVGLTFATLRQRFDQKVLHADMFARTSGMPVLGVVPDHPALQRLSRRPAVNGR